MLSQFCRYQFYATFGGSNIPGPERFWQLQFFRLTIIFRQNFLFYPVLRNAWQPQKYSYVRKKLIKPLKNWKTEMDRPITEVPKIFVKLTSAKLRWLFCFWSAQILQRRALMNVLSDKTYYMLTSYCFVFEVLTFFTPVVVNVRNVLEESLMQTFWSKSDAFRFMF